MGNKVILLGNEAIARGIVEAGCEVASAYPGTPSSEILPAVARFADELGTKTAVEWSVKAWVAAECNSEVKELLMIAAKRELDQQGLRMPPPQMQIHVAKETSLSSSDAESVDPIRQRPRMRHSA